MFVRLAMLFVLVPLVELALLLSIADALDSWSLTLALVILTGIVGAWMARREGLQCWQRAQQQFARGQLPADSLLDGLLILIAGALLITPGVLTDLVGFGLLVPPIRRAARHYLTERIKARLIVVPPPPGRPNAPPDDVIDVEHHPPDDPQA